MSNILDSADGGLPEGEGAVPGERDSVSADVGAAPGEGDAVPGGARTLPGGAGGGGRVPGAVDAARARRRLITTIKESLREMSTQLSLLNHHVGARVDLKDVDLNCLDLIARHGPISPTALARRAGLHPATVTGILDRLQRGGWVVRDRDPGAADRRSVAVRPLRERGADLYRLYSGMNTSLDEICTGYTDTELELLAGFLRRTTDAGQSAAADLAPG
jgi:DNA-binding MarR family transcriptional regulator